MSRVSVACEESTKECNIMNPHKGSSLKSLFEELGECQKPVHGTRASCLPSMSNLPGFTEVGPDGSHYADIWGCIIGFGLGGVILIAAVWYALAKGTR
jgi:hypothetical protein